MARGFGRTLRRTGPSVREPPDADRQLALLPVGLLAKILPYPIFISLYSSGKVKLEIGNQVTITINVIS